MSEFDLIARIRARFPSPPAPELGIGDDGALLVPRPGHLLAVSTDSLLAGVHFRAEDPPADVGHKAAAVNLSDLAAMAAEPAACLLALSLPGADAGWLDGFLDGLGALARRHGMALVGGDTTRGPLAVTLTVLGWVPSGQALRRDAARPGDEVWVTGTLGDAAAALALGEAADPWLLARLRRPEPRCAAGLALRGLAHAAIDLSDGLLGDLGHVLAASGCGADLELAALPASPALCAAVPEAETRWRYQLCGGDDYELAFTAPPERREAVRAALAAQGVAATRIGRIDQRPGLRLQRPDGRLWPPPARAWQHFADPP